MTLCQRKLRISLRGRLLLLGVKGEERGNKGKVSFSTGF